MTADHGVEDLLRELAPRVLGIVARRSGDFAAAEDAVQEALLAAATHWPSSGVPENPRGWLVTAAMRRFVDEVRADVARRRREETFSRTGGASGRPGAGPGGDAGAEVVHHDDSLTVLLLCCHPALTAASAVVLTLRAVGGLTTAEIASAFAVSEATMAQRISRAKRQVRDAGAVFELPSSPDALSDRVARVLRVLYLVYTEGYAASGGSAVRRTDLCAEAIRLARLCHRLVPENRSATALLALLILLEARAPARVDEHGLPVLLSEQDRSRWDARMVAEGTALLDSTLDGGDVGEYQVQAAIAAVHDRAPRAEETDWPQVLALYSLLARVAPSPFVELGRAVALAEVEGPEAARLVLAGIGPTLGEHPRWHAVHGHVAELAGDLGEARRRYLGAARRTTNLAEQRALTMRAARLGRSAGARSE